MSESWGFMKNNHSTFDAITSCVIWYNHTIFNITTRVTFATENTHPFWMLSFWSNCSKEMRFKFNQRNTFYILSEFFLANNLYYFQWNCHQKAQFKLFDLKKKLNHRWFPWNIWVSKSLTNIIIKLSRFPQSNAIIKTFS